MAKRNSQSLKTSLPCEAFWITAAIALWLIACLPSFWMQMAGFCLFGIFAGIRFSGIKVLLVWVLLFGAFCGSSLLQKPAAAEEGIYTIVSIRNGYALTKNGHAQAVVYEPESFTLMDRVKLSDFEPVHSNNNIGLFSFQNFLKKKGVEQAAQKAEIQPYSGFSLKRMLWKKVNASPYAALYRLLFYGLSDNEDWEWVSSLGLPLMALIAMLRGLLERYFYKRTAGLILAAIQIGFLFLVPVSDAAIRLLIFTLGGLFFEEWSRRWPFCLLVFVLLRPFSVTGMSIVLPAGLSFFSHYQLGSARKKVSQIAWCALLQILYMGELNLLLLAGFLWMRKIFGWFFLLSLPGLIFPSVGGLLQSLLDACAWSFSWCTISGAPPFWYLAISFVLFWSLSWRWKNAKALGMISLLCLYPFVWRLDPFFHVYQIDVGQGDAALFVAPFQKEVVMIDAAGRMNHDLASELFVPFLQKRQIRRIDSLLITHGDFDHDGSAEALASQFPVSEIIRYKEEGSLPKWMVMLEHSYLAEAAGVDENSSSGDQAAGNTSEEEEDKNDTSLVCMVQFDGFRYLYMGDASIKVEADLAERYDLQADLLKLGHHGSKTSSDEEFLRKVRPSLALISSGFQNRYGHPSLEVLKRLEQLGIARINTADHGMIHAFSFGPVLFVESADGLLSWIVRDL